MATTKKLSSNRLLQVAITLVVVMIFVILLMLILRFTNQPNVQGNIVVVEGDCMPPVSGQCASESQNTRKMNVALYTAIETSADGAPKPLGKVAETRNVTNNYRLDAKSGKYYLFYRYVDSEDTQEYCAPVLQLSNGTSEPCEVNIPNTGSTKVDITFNFVTY